MRDTFDQASLDDADLLATDLDAGHLDRSVRRREFGGDPEIGVSTAYRRRAGRQLAGVAVGGAVRLGHLVGETSVNPLVVDHAHGNRPPSDL